MAVQLFVKGVNDTQYQMLDLFAAEPIKLNLSVANIIDPLAANSVFSRTFRVPHTANNGPFFKAVFNVNSTNFDASKKADAYINDNGVFFALGNVVLSSIYVNEKTNNPEYEINFYGETSDFGSKIGGGFLNQVDLTAYNHALNYANVTNSWTGGLLAGNVVYPLIEWGYKYQNGVPTQGTLSKGGTRSFIFNSSNTNHAISFNQLKPTLKAKALWDAIFDESGYTYNSTFLETDPTFTNLFVVAEDQPRTSVNDDLKFVANDNSDSNQIGANGASSFISTTKLLDFTTEVSDPSNSYNSPTSTYTSQAIGSTTFQIDGYAEGVWPNSFATSAVLFEIVDLATGIALGTASPLTILNGPNLFTKSITVSLSVGQAVRLRATSIGTVGSNTGYIEFSGCTYQVTSAPNLVAMSSFMPSNIRKIDFMRSIINRFRLVFVPSRDNEKHFEITPWKDWVLQGSAKDWTTKLDTSKDMKITPLFYGQNRLQIYKDQEDADFPNYNYQLDYKQTYGQRNIDSNNELIKGEKIYMDQFAPLPIYPVGGVIETDAEYGFLIPHIAKDTNTERQPIQPKLRLGYYNGLINAPLQSGYSWWILNQAGTPVAKTTYPLMSQYSSWPVTSTTYDLNWENEPPLYDTENSGLSINQTNYDTYNVFWKTWYDTTFDPYSRIVEANFVLGYEDILDIKFNDYIFVKDAWYMINKITDYVVGQETNCRVELVKVGGNIGLVIPPSGPSYKAQELCFSPSSVCDAFCCTGSGSSATYYIDGTDLTSSTHIYQNIGGTLLAQSGYYSDGSVVAIVSAGLITSFANTASCDCTPPLLVEYTVCYGSTLCEACCCVNEEISVYGDGVDLTSSLNVYYDSLGTLPATGWFKETSATEAIYVDGGITQVVGICDTCTCNPTVYPHEVLFSDEALCDVCCNGTTVTIWTDSPTFVSSTVVYIDNVPLTLSGAGWYYDGTDVLIVDGSGNVTAIGTCASCTCLYYYKAENCQSPGLYANFSHPTALNIGDVVDSPIYVDQCWTIIDLASDGTPVDNIYPDCATCLPAPGPCTCVEYEIVALTGGAISWIDCDTGVVMYMDVPAGVTNQCACEDSVIALAGKMTITPVALCDTPENEFIITGGFTSYDGVSTDRIALMDSAGNVQDSFIADTFIEGDPYVLVYPPATITNEDSIFVAGSFDQYGATTVNYMVKLDYTGAIDTSYDPSTGFDRAVESLGQFADGTKVATGYFDNYKGTTAYQIVAFKDDGSIDTTFDYGSGFGPGSRGVGAVYPTNMKVKNNVLYTRVLANIGADPEYNGNPCSRFIAIDRSGNLITNFVRPSYGSYFASYDIDDVGRVYIAYIDYTSNFVYVERLLPSGEVDPTYLFSIELPDLSTIQSAYLPQIAVNERYEVFVAVPRYDSSLIGGWVFKVTSGGELDPIFGVNQVDAIGSTKQIAIQDGYVYIPIASTAASAYNGDPVGALIRIDQNTGYLDPTFNNSTPAFGGGLKVVLKN